MTGSYEDFENIKIGFACLHGDAKQECDDRRQRVMDYFKVTPEQEKYLITAVLMDLEHNFPQMWGVEHVHSDQWFGAAISEWDRRAEEEGRKPIRLTFQCDTIEDGFILAWCYVNDNYERSEDW